MISCHLEKELQVIKKMSENRASSKVNYFNGPFKDKKVEQQHSEFADLVQLFDRVCSLMDDNFNDRNSKKNEEEIANLKGQVDQLKKEKADLVEEVRKQSVHCTQLNEQIKKLKDEEKQQTSRAKKKFNYVTEQDYMRT